MSIFLEKTLLRWRMSAPDIVSRVMDRLEELGYIDDAKFATWYIDQRTGRKPKGERAIAIELKQKGIDKSLIHVEEPQENLAKRAIKPKQNLWKHLPLIKQKQKMGAFLMRRGFSSEIVWRVVDEILKKE